MAIEQYYLVEAEVKVKMMVAFVSNNGIEIQEIGSLVKESLEEELKIKHEGKPFHLIDGCVKTFLFLTRPQSIKLKQVSYSDADTTK